SAETGDRAALPSDSVWAQPTTVNKKLIIRINRMVFSYLPIKKGSLRSLFSGYTLASNTTTEISCECWKYRSSCHCKQWKSCWSDHLPESGSNPLLHSW